MIVYAEQTCYMCSSAMCGFSAVGHVGDATLTSFGIQLLSGIQISVPSEKIVALGGRGGLNSTQ